MPIQFEDAFKRKIIPPAEMTDRQLEVALMRATKLRDAAKARGAAKISAPKE